MKLRKIVVAFLLVWAGSSWAGLPLEAQDQGRKFTVRVENVTMKEAIEAIKEKGDYSFLIRNKDIDLTRKVTVDVNEGTLEEMLRQMLADTDIRYEVNGNRIVVFHSAPTQQARGSFVLKGKVVDVHGEAVIGANIRVVDGTGGTITDVDGNFSLEVKPGDRITVSYIGYASTEMAVGDGQPISVTLHEDSRMIDEVVVVGYGVQKKANLTGAVSSVKMDEVLGNRPVVSVSNALMGAMPGLQVTGTSGQPGSELSFNIRGTNSINGGSPLVLVDNVEMDINMLDPNDIESVTVLKDAAASAIYGARAAFGVILVTTKKGSEDKRLTINYSNNFSFSTPMNMPKKASPMETVQAYKDMGWNGTYRTGEDIDTWLGFLEEYRQNPGSYPEGYAEVDGMRYQLAETDLFDDMLETGFQQTHNLAVSGGTKGLSYRMSAGMVSQDGVMVTNKDRFKRYNISSYIRSDVYSWITPELDIKYTNMSSSMPNSSAAYGIWGAAVAFPSYFPLGEVETSDGALLPVNSPRNQIMLGAPKLNDRDNVRIFGKVTITPFKDLKIIGEYTFNRKDKESTTNINKFDYANGNSNFSQETSTPNSSYEVGRETTDYTALNFYGTYAKTFGKHDLTVMGGFNQESSSYHYVWAQRLDMINEDLPSLSQGTGEYKNSESFSEYKVRGLFYRINYDFAGKYLIETNGRYDGSSKFPSDSRFGFFPSVSAGWRVSEEAFMDWSDSFLSNLKLRGSWGNIGNQSVDPYQFVPAMSAANPNWVVDTTKPTTLQPPALVSNSFTWEKVSTLDFGFDLGLFDNRLNATFDWYRRDTKGMLAPGMELPGVLGADAPTQNTADLRSKGWEISVDWNDRIGDWSYYVGFNLYDSRTHITKYNNESQLLGDRYYREGMELGEIWGYDTDRFYTVDDFEEGTLQADLTGGTLKPGIPKVEGYNPNPGDVLYVDHNDDGIINNGDNTALNSGDMRIIGNNTRRYQYGIRGGASWKGISLSFILQGVGKRDLWIMNELFYPQYDPYSTIFNTQLDYWTPERTDTYFPRLYTQAAGNSAANRMTQTHFLQNGAYLTIRNISLSYTFPKQWLNPWGVQSLQVFFSGENLFTFDHLPKGLDPERSAEYRGFNYPYLRQFSFGINLTL